MYDGHGTKILGGSEAQSAQIYDALRNFRDCEALPGYDPFAAFQVTSAAYVTGSEVSFIPASPKSVRGPHVATLRLDEVDEIDPDIRDAAMGMAMAIDGMPSSITMTSTWHRIAGPMAELVERGRSGDFPVFSFCIFEVLECCPEVRSGPNLEHCPECPIMTWCHADRDSHPGRLPKAKRSRGHYTTDALIQKVKAVSLRAFESDYLCLRPRAAGVWFTAFDERQHVTPAAEFQRNLTVHLAIDPGVHCGAVWFQARSRLDGSGCAVNVFADYFAEGLSAEANAQAILAKTQEVCGIGAAGARVSMDPAGSHRNAVGPVVRAEFVRVGCCGRNGLELWPTLGAHRPKADTLGLIEALLQSADGAVSLTIHPRCTHLIRALLSYSRARRNNQWMDYPEPECHPHEDLIDPLAGGLSLEFPAGRAPQPRLRRVHASSLR
jgi:hypothetical protein